MKSRTLSLVAAGVALIVASTTNADGPVRPSPAGRIVPAPLPSPPAPPSPAAVGRADHGLSSVEHLRRAAEHLEAAGAGELAREVRDEADALLEGSMELLHQKREQVARLQGEIEELEAMTGCQQQVMLKCRVIDVDIAKARRLGVSLSLLTDHGVAEGSPGESGMFPIGLNGGNEMEAFVDALAANGVARILAEPVLVTISGRPAALRSGGEFPVLLPDGVDSTRIEYREFGLRLETVPVVLGNGRLRLEIAPELATRDFENAVTVNGSVVPGLNVRRMNTQVELEFGETATLIMPAPGGVERIRRASADDGAGDDARTVTIFCVTPERVRPTNQPSVGIPHPAHLLNLPLEGSVP